MESERNVLEKKQHGNYLDFIQWLSDSILRHAFSDFKKMGKRIFVFIVGGATRSERLYVCKSTSMEVLTTSNIFLSRNYRSASLPSWRVIKHSIMSVAVTFTTPVFNGSPMRCSCLGTMIDFESAAASSWVPVIDQVLLTASVIFTYMAGVIPSGGSYIRSQTNKSNDLLLPESPIFFVQQKRKISLVVTVPGMQ